MPINRKPSEGGETEAVKTASPSTGLPMPSAKPQGLPMPSREPLPIPRKESRPSYEEPEEELLEIEEDPSEEPADFVSDEDLQLLDEMEEQRRPTGGYPYDSDESSYRFSEDDEEEEFPDLPDEDEDFSGIGDEEPFEIEDAPEDFSSLSSLDDEDEEKPSKKKKKDKSGKGSEGFKAPSLNVTSLLRGLLKAIGLILKPFLWIAGLILKPFAKLTAKTGDRLVNIIAYILASLVLLILPIALFVKLNSGLMVPVSQDFPDSGKIELVNYRVDKSTDTITVEMKNTGETQQDVIAELNVSSSKLLNPFTWFNKKPIANCKSEVITINADEAQDVTLTCDAPLAGQGLVITGTAY